MNTQQGSTALHKTESKSLKYFFYKMTKMRTRLIMLVIFIFTAYPAFITGAIAYTGSNGYKENMNSFYIISITLCIFSLISMVIITYFNGITGFDYLNQKSVVDMNYSLPLTNRQRFFADFFAGIVPVAISYILSSFIGLILLAGFKTKEITKVVETLGWGNIIGIVLTGLVFLIMLYCLIVFSTTLCGRLFEASLYPMVISIIIPSIIALIGNMVFMNVREMDVSDQIVTLIAGTSPFGLLFCSMISTVNEVTLLIYQPAVFIPIILIIAALIILSYYFNKYRKSENVGKPFAYKKAFTVFLFLIMFCITGLFYIFIDESSYDSRGGIIFAMIIVTLIVFLFFDLTAKRGFKAMHKAVLRYILMVGGSVAVSVMLINSNGFGRGLYIPEPNKIESVSVKFSMANFDENYYRKDNFSSDSLSTEYTSTEDIAVLHSLNEASNKIHYDYSGTVYYSGSRMNYYNYSETEVFCSELTYKLKSGREVTRYIFLSLLEETELLKLQMKSGYIEAITAYLDAMVYNTDPVNDKNIMDYAVLMNITGIGTPIHNSEDILKLYEAFKKDLEAETFEEMYFPSEQPLGKIKFEIKKLSNESSYYDGYEYYEEKTYYYGDYSYYIKPYYTNLLSVMNELGLEIPDFKENAVNYQCTIGLFKDYYDCAFYSLDTLLQEQNDKAYRLLSVAQPIYLADKGFIIDINGRTFVIPPEYEELSKEVYEELKISGEPITRYGEHILEIFTEEQYINEY